MPPTLPLPAGAVHAGVPSGPLMSMRDIAELAGVRRPVVTVWRRRHADFPEPVAAGAGQPLFEPRQVADWLVATGRAERDRVEPDLSLHTLVSLGRRLLPSALVAAVTALICLRHLDDDEPLVDATGDIAAALRGRAAAVDPDDELLLSEIRRLPRGAGWLAAAVDDLVEAAWDCRGAFERIMAARHRLRAAELVSTAVRPQLATLIAKVSGAAERARREPGIVVADLSAGAGDLLTAVVDLIGDDAVPRCTAAERDPYLARLIRRRLAVHGLSRGDMDVRIAGELPDSAGEPDVIVTQVRYVPGEDRSAGNILDMIDDVSLRLRPGRTAVVLGPADVLTGELPPYSGAERARASLLKDGMVECVIRLPGGLIPFRPGYETALWVLTSARDSPWRGRVLLADVSDRELTDEVADTLAEDVVTWRREGYDPDAHSRTFGVQVLISDLVQPPKPLTARPPRSAHIVTAGAADRLARVLELETELDRIGARAAAVRRSVRGNLVAEVRARPASATIGKLAGQRVLSVLNGTRIDPGDIGANGHHPVLGPDEVLGARRAGERTLDRAVLAARYSRARLTEPGDVLVTAVPCFGVRLDRGGFAVVEFPVRVLRLRETRESRLTPRVLAALLGVGISPARPAGAVRAARRIEDLQVPLLTADETTRLDALLGELDARRDHAQREIDALDELGQLIAAGLSDGTLSYHPGTT